MTLATILGDDLREQLEQSPTSYLIVRTAWENDHEQVRAVMPKVERASNPIAYLVACCKRFNAAGPSTPQPPDLPAGLLRNRKGGDQTCELCDNTGLVILKARHTEHGVEQQPDAAACPQCQRGARKIQLHPGLVLASIDQIEL